MLARREGELGSTTASVDDVVLICEIGWGTGIIEAKGIRRSGVIASAVYDWSGK